MKTKEEILDEYGCPDIPFNEHVTMYYPAIINAMEEYAQQQVKNCSIPDVVGQSEQLKKFLQYVANASEYTDRNKMNREADELLNKLF